MRYILNLFKKVFHRHDWIYGYTNNPDGTTDPDNPGTWYGPVVRRCETCDTIQDKW